MYRQESMTDPERTYSFRASPAPAREKWTVMLLSESVKIDVGENGPIPGPDFVLTLQVRKK